MDIKQTPDLLVTKTEVKEWKHGFAEVNGIKLHYVEQGEGFPVLMVNGMPEYWYVYRHQIPALARAGFRAIAVDSRGYGQSDRPDGLHEYTHQKKTDELLGLLDILGIEKAVFVGHDWGTNWCWAAGRLYPDRVERIICTIGAGGIRHWDMMRRHGVPTWPVDHDPNRPKLGSRDIRTNFFIWDRWMRQVSWMNLQVPGYAEHELSKDPDWLEALTRTCSAPTRGSFPDREYVQMLVDTYGTVEGMKGSIDHYRNFGLLFERIWELHSVKISCPCMLLAAEDDPWAPPRDSDEEIIKNTRETIPNLTIRWIEGSGHWVQNEQPEEFNRHTLEFLKDLKGR